MEDVCSVQKLGFNGGSNCTIEANYVSCKLLCPEEVEFSFTPASEYICTYDKGVFEPQPVPQCKNGPDYQIVPIGSSRSSFLTITNHSWIVEDTFISKSSYSNEIIDFTSSDLKEMSSLQRKVSD